MTDNNNKEINLLSCSLEGGCSAKIPPDILEKTLSGIIKPKTDKNLLIDIDLGDDAGVYKISDDNAIIFTVDYFPPMVEDPYEFGQIAACNSISDVYAMGGSPKLALNITLFPKNDNLEILAQILKGGQDKAQEAGVLIVGGHTITDTTIKYGMSVVGFVHPQNITANSNAKAGDTLILTKPIGTGSSMAAFRQGLIKRNEIEDVFTSMKTLNKKAGEIMNKYKIKAATDITGFGLSGHLHKIALASNVTIEIEAKSVPLFSAVYNIVDGGCIPGAAFTNMRYVGGSASYKDGLDYNLKMLMSDPQSSGGILMCVDSEKAESVLADLWREGVQDAAIVGRVLEKSEHTLLVK